MFWKKCKENDKPLYDFDRNVSFDVAFKALKEGYMIRDCGYKDIYYIMINDRIFCLHDRDNKHNCYELDEFSKNSMLQDTWKVLEPLSNKNTNKCDIIRVSDWSTTL